MSLATAIVRKFSIIHAGIYPMADAAATPDSRQIDIDDITAWLTNAPPVYAPGGPVAWMGGLPEGTTSASLAAVEVEAAARGAVLTVVVCPTEASATEALLRERGYDYASSWYYGPSASPETPAVPEDLTLRAAVAADVPRILELADRKRDRYETFSPIFWKKAPTPYLEFAPYITSQVENPENIALVAERAGTIAGFVIAQCRNLDEGYIDDYAVADDAADWLTVGVALLAEAGRLAQEQGVVSFMIVVAHADSAKRGAIEQLGFTLRKNWWVKAIG
jgi:hypothetical protein